MKADVIIQARTGSTRLPNKIMKSLSGKPMIQQIVERVKQCKKIDKIIVATTDLEQDDVVERFCLKNGYLVFRGSSEDVLDRYYQCAKTHHIDHIVRMTADNALFDPIVVAQGVDYYFSANKDYIYYRQGLPLGTAVEIFRFSALEKAWQECFDPECREHVTVYMYRSSGHFSYEIVPAEGVRHDALRLTTDTEQDFQLVSRIYNELYNGNSKFTLDDVYSVLKRHPEWEKINKSIVQKTVKYK